MEKRRVRIYKAQEGGQPSIDQLGYPGAQAQEQQASGEEQLMQIIYQDISNEVPEGAIVAKLVNAYNMDPAMANQYVQQVYGILQNKIDQDELEEEDNSEEEAQEQVEDEILNENKPMSKIQGHTDLAMEDEEVDVTDLEDEDMLKYGGTPRYQDGGEQDYIEAMNNDQMNWPKAETPIVFPDVSEYLPSGLESYLANDASNMAWTRPEESEQTMDEESLEDYTNLVVDPEEFRMGGFKTKKGYVNSVMKLVKKQMGGDEQEQDIKASDADPRGDNLRKNRLDAFVGSIKKEGNMTIAKEEAEKQFEEMQAMHQQMMMQQPQLQNFIPEDYEGVDYMQFGGQQRRAMRRMNRALRRMPFGVPGMVGPVTKFDVHRTGIFGGPKEYTIEFGESPLMQLAANPFLSHAYGYGYKTKTTKTPAKLITEKVRNTINNQSTKEVASATKSEAAAKSAWDLDQNDIPDSIQSNVIESKIKTRTPNFITDPVGTAVEASKAAQPSFTPANNSVEDMFKKNPPHVGETNSAYLFRTTGNPGFYNNTDTWNGTTWVGNSLNKKLNQKEEGGLVDNPMPDQFGNLQRFIGGGFDPSIPDLNQADIDDMYSKDTSDPYMPQAQYGGFWGAMMRNYFPANMPQRYAYSQTVRPAYNRATGQQFANIPGFNPYAQIKDIQVTKKGIFGQPKRYTVTYNNNPSGKPGDKRLANTNSFEQLSTAEASAKSKEQAPKTKNEQKEYETKVEQRKNDIYSNTEGLSGKARRQIRRGERRTARDVARGMEEFPEDPNYKPASNAPVQSAHPAWSQMYMSNNASLPSIAAEAQKKEYGGDLHRFIPQALLGKETPVSMVNNPANSKLTLPTKSSKEVGQQLMMDSRKKIEEEAKFEPDEYSVDYKAKKKWLGDTQGAILSANAAGEGLAGWIDRWKNRNNDVDVYNNTTADDNYARDPSKDSGDYSITGSDYGLYRSPDQGQTWGSRSAQYGGASDYSEGAVVDMTEEELAEFLANGGQVEYL
jgi:hypothetical protein